MTALFWQTFSCSVRGATHVRNGLPNQDYSWPQQFERVPVALLAVADGHGSARSFRSDRGARIAVKAVIDQLHQFRNHGDNGQSLSFINRWAEMELPKGLVRSWRDAVYTDYQEQEFTEEELGPVRARETQHKVEQLLKNPLIAYGSTILAALITDQFALYVQLGDGDILTVSGDGEVTRPIPHDDRLIANETTSLCLSDAERDVNVIFQPFHEGISTAPELVLLSTDGYANSFRDEDEFRKVGSDFLRIIREDGSSSIANDQLPDWLNNASISGSGDDISLAVAWKPMKTQWEIHPHSLLSHSFK